MTDTQHDALIEEAGAAAYVACVKAGQVKRRTRGWLQLKRETYDVEYAAAAQAAVRQYLRKALARTPPAADTPPRQVEDVEQLARRMAEADGWRLPVGSIRNMAAAGNSVAAKYLSLALSHPPAVSKDDAEVERVAKAICRASEFGKRFPSGEELWRYWIPEAEAAIAALSPAPKPAEPRFLENLDDPTGEIANGPAPAEDRTTAKSSVVGKLAELRSPQDILGPVTDSVTKQHALYPIEQAQWEALTAMSQRIERLETERNQLLDAVKYAHGEGFEWPADPIPESLRSAALNEGQG